VVAVVAAMVNVEWQRATDDERQSSPNTMPLCICNAIIHFVDQQQTDDKDDVCPVMVYVYIVIYDNNE
jgi:hypothetical protein